MLRLLEKRGWKKAGSQTPLEFAAAVPAGELCSRLAADRTVSIGALRKSSGSNRADVFLAPHDPRFASLAKTAGAMNKKVWLLLGVLLAAAIVVLFIPPVQQVETYHRFADQRRIGGITNCFDVVSNLFFLIAGAIGIGFVLRDAVRGGHAFIDARERWPYLAFFIAIALTAFGSAYYHIQPNDGRLVWDRIPITMGFMSLLTAVVAERVNVKAGLRLLAPLLILGVGSVVYWSVTQAHGHGDLRPYGFVQFGSILAFLLLLELFPPRYTRGADFVISFGFYALAKLLEVGDRWVFTHGRIVSGHTLKHIFVAVSAYWIFRMLALRHQIPPATKPAR
jgi:predicted membrane channel-forming protein YqfA (hemolysin III family)